MRPSETHSSSSQDCVPAGSQHFEQTHWSVVLNAANGDSTRAHESLEKLCRAYWFPLYAYVRRQGHGPHDAQDLTQEFFARLLEKNYLAAVDRNKGKFRSFLLASLKHFLAKEWRKANAQKRGGGQKVFSIDAEAAEASFCLEPADTMTADKIYERRWALALLEQVLGRLREEYTAGGKEKLFDKMKSALSGGKSSGTYADIGQELGMSEGAVKVAAHRLRQRYRELLREEIAQTVSSPGEIDDEQRNLFAALSG